MPFTISLSQNARAFIRACWLLFLLFASFGERFDRIDHRLLGVESKVAGIDRRLDAEAIRRSELKLPRRVHDLEEEVHGRGRSKHPKHLPL